MKRWCFILLCCVLVFSGFTQNLDLDSLQQTLTQTREDKAKVMILSDLSYKYFNSDTDAALLLAQQALDLARKIKFTQGEARALCLLGLSYRVLSDIPKAMRASLRGVQLAEEHGFRQEAAICNYNIGGLYLDLLNDYSKALSYLRKARQWNSPVQGATGEECQSVIEIYYGIVYEKLNMPDSSEFYYNEALTYTSNVPYLRLIILNFKGLLQLKLKNYQEALALLRQSTVKKISTLASAEIYFNLASCFREMGQTDSCSFYAKNSLAEAQQIGYQEYVMKSATLLAEVYEGQNNSEVIRFYKIAKLANDKVYGEQKVRDLQRIITEEMQRQQVAEKEKTEYQNRVRQFALLGGLAVVLLVAFLLYRNNRQKQKSNVQLQAHNRKLKIEAALERVRSQSMAMHQSDELSGVINTLFQQLTELGINIVSSWVTLMHTESKELEIWMTHSGGNAVPTFVKTTEYETFEKEMQAWQAGQHISLEIPSEIAQGIVQRIFKVDINPPSDKPFWHLLQHWHRYGYIGLSTWDTATEEEKDLIGRFSRVFEQTYTRFLDIQKAEAQAREAQIEAALERVRSRTMAMQSSQELSELVQVVYQQFNSLQIANWGANIMLMHQDEPSLEIWLSENDQKVFPHSFFIRGTDMLFVREQWEGWYSKKEQFTLHLFGDKKKEYDDVTFEHHDFRLLPDAVKAGIRQIKEAYFHFSRMQYGFLVAISVEGMISSEGMMVLGRFAKVFEQTYTRFLDLKKAEAQAREVQIEAALERVRSRAVAMRHSDELSESAELLYQEFLKMGVESYSCGYLINDDEKQEWKIWLTNPGEKFFKQYWTCPYFADHNLKARYESWKDQDEFHYALLEGKENQAHHLVISKYAPWKEAMLDTLPPQLVFNSAHFSLGHLLVISPDRLAPELELAMVRFAKVFDLAYRRFLDLQIAEAQAREAKIDAALDRVRAEIASMRSTQDLEHITPLVWRELTALEVPFFRCGVFIMDEEKELVHTYLSTPEGKSLSVLDLPMDGAETTRQTVQHWRTQTVYLDHWDQQQFIQWVQSLTEQGYIREGKAYQGSEEAPQTLALHFVPFQQGMLYIGSSESLSEVQIELVKRLADTFTVAYARYEDFTSLEEAKHKVEATLSELKATQAQLIQSEKLASLGELTAGIAHEIQNPLNFVNNFAEVSTEMLDEMHEELEKGDTTEAIAIATDLKTNLEKINHHGQRASSIVKGMLEHSRASTGVKEPTDLNALADEYLRLAYHGLRAKDSSFNATMETHFDPDLPKVSVMPQDIGRVLLNLINNAFYAVAERSESTVGASLAGAHAPYQPTVTVSTQKTGDQIIIKVQDNGNGIPESIRDKIFQPFFTTKPTGQGTGLGLSLAYDIVTKGHGGTLEVESTEGIGSAFILKLPLI